LPRKITWRKVLSDWQNEVCHPGFPKQYFPTLLKWLFNATSRTIGQNLIFGFKTCGLFPTDHQKPLQKQP